jgi:hypothetical protein
MTTRTRSAQPFAGLRPEQVAFLGEYTATTPTKQVFVQLLCWPTVSAGWAMLSQASTALRSVRGEAPAFSAAKGTSWIHHVAPQLSFSLERDAAAAETTLATLIRRLPLRFAVAIVEHEAGQPTGSDALRYRSLFTASLTAYGAYLESANQPACRALMAPSMDQQTGQAQQQIYDELLPHLDNATRLAPLALSFWPDSRMPLPLELAQLTAAAVGRHVQDSTEASPLFETVRTHLVPPSRFHAIGTQGRRRK